MSEGRVAIIGLGLIGGSLGLALRERGIFVIGQDVDPARIRLAFERGIVDEPVTELSDATQEVDVVVLATPVLTVIQQLRIVGSATSSRTMILDVGSVKAPVIQAMETISEPGRAIGGHPLAGSEQSGPEFASGEIFRDRPFLLCPSASTAAETCERAEWLALAVDARPIFLDAAEHDSILARTSHVPQLVSSLLATFLEDGDQNLAGLGLRDMTRLAESGSVIWRDVAIANRGNIASGLRDLAREILLLEERIESSDGECVEALMRRGAARASGVREAVAS